jgi:hypothetical protein
MIAFSLTCCTSVNINASGYDKTASLTSSDKKFTILKHFSREMKCWYTFLNLIPLTEPNIAELLREETVSAHGDAIINVTIKGETTMIDAAIPVAMSIVGSMVSPQRGAFLGLLCGARTYTVEGDVIKYVE